MGIALRGYTLSEINADPQALAATKTYISTINDRLADRRLVPKITR
jgi:hypothetical protein